MKPSHKMLAIWVLLIAIFLGIWTLLSPARPPATKNSYSDFLAMVEADRDTEIFVERVTIRDGDYLFTVRDPQAGTTSTRLAEGPREVSSDVIEKLRDRKVQVTFERVEASAGWSGALTTAVPMLIFVLVILFFVKSLSGRVIAFGKSLLESIPKKNRDGIRIDADLIGLDETKWALNRLDENHAVFTEPKGRQVSIPYTFVAAVWPSNADGEHTVSLTCSLTGKDGDSHVLLQRERSREHG